MNSVRWWTEQWQLESQCSAPPACGCIESYNSVQCPAVGAQSLQTRPSAEHCPIALAGSTSVTAIYRQLRSGPTLTVAVCPPENKFRLVDFASATPRKSQAVVLSGEARR